MASSTPISQFNATPTLTSQGDSSSRPSNINYTPSGTPYLTLPLSTPTPIYLTPYYQTDIPDLQAIMSLPALYNTLLSIPIPYTLTDATNWITLQLTQINNIPPIQVLRIGSPDPSGQLIGSVGLMSCTSEENKKARPLIPDTGSGGVGRENEYELGYYLHPDHRGKGIVTVAITELVNWARGLYGVNPVVRVEEGNAASRRLIERVEGWRRDEERDAWVDWPVVKGGGKRKLLFFKWRVDDP